MFVLDEKIFDYNLGEETGGEFYHTDVIKEYAKDHPIAVVEQRLWIPIGYPEDITKAEQTLKLRANNSVEV